MSQRDRMEILAQLQAAMASKDMPDNMARSAERVLYHFQKKPRLTLLWYSVSDPAPVVNRFLSKDVLSAGLTLPPIKFRYGAAEKTQITKPDGSKIMIAGYDLEEILKYKPIFFVIYLPATLLQYVDFMFMSVPRDIATGSRAVKWAAGETDIGVWCTDHYTDEEANIWYNMPENIQDHSFLTFMPNPEDRSAYSAGFQRAIDNDDGMFRHVSRIAFTDDNEIAYDELFTQVNEKVLSAQSAALDQAKVLLSSLKKLGIDVSDEVNKNDVVLAKDAKEDVLVLGDISEARGPDAKTAPPSNELDTESQGSAINKLSDNDVAILSNYHRSIEDFARKTYLSLTNEEHDIAEAIIEKINDICASLYDIAEEMETEGAAKDKLLSISSESLDIIQLLQIENSQDTVIDTLDILQQIKTDISLLVTVT